MSEYTRIWYIECRNLDKGLWDETLSKCTNKLIYAESVYLDHMCPGWCALLQEDLQAMMPLPIRKKMGVRYAFQPLFIQQLGVFYTEEDSVEIDAFVGMTTILAPLIDMNFNYANKLPIAERCCNYILDLSHPFDELKKKFRKDLITKAETHRLIYDEGNIDEAIEAYRREILPRAKGVSDASLQRFRNLCHHYHAHNRAICRRVVSTKNETLGYAIFLMDEHRIYYMLSATEKNGKKTDANPFLLHEVIKEFSGRPLIFDFEGSEIPGVKYFFKKFSPEEQLYYRVRVNKLDPLQKGIKSLRDFIRK